MCAYSFTLLVLCLCLHLHMYVFIFLYSHVENIVSHAATTCMMWCFLFLFHFYIFEYFSPNKNVNTFKVPAMAGCVNDSSLQNPLTE